jgi:hypothetical protein
VIIKEEDKQPKRERTLEQVKKMFATGYDARWHNVKSARADAKFSYMRDDAK